jgi:anti-sigma B factor antagonist
MKQKDDGMTTLDIRDMNDVVVVSFKHAQLVDDAVVSQVAREFRKLPLEAVADRKLLLNFQHVAFMGSTMIGQIISLSELCKGNEVDLKLCCISSEIMEVFKLTKLHKRLKIYGSEAKALRAFGSPTKRWFQR